jgi:serine/threonine protein kinase
MHEVDVVHGDIKPSNALISEHSVLRLSDFGEAKIRYSSLADSALKKNLICTLTCKYFKKAKNCCSLNIFVVN